VKSSASFYHLYFL